MKEDGSRVVVGARCGWVRVFNDEEDVDAPGTLVYLTNTTIVRDICRDLVLADHLTLWLQYGGGEGRRLGATETPLSLQDEFLKKIGYSDNSRRARLGIDPDLRYIIRFYIGPASGELIERSGSVYILKGLVLPQWKKRTVVLMANKMYIYPGAGVTASLEEVDLEGATVEATRNTKCGRKVLRISASRQLFLGFDFNWERSLWWSWIVQASETEASSSRVDLSGLGLSSLTEAAVQCWPDVQQLSLARNRLQPGSLQLLQRLHALRTLNLADNGWAVLPADVTALTALTSLDLSDNQLTTLPDQFTNLTRLEELRLDRNGLKQVPGRRGAYPRLKTLSLAHNKLVSFPAFLDNDPAMRELTLLDVGEGVKDADADVGEDLRSINLRANLLKGSIILGNYGNLTHLDVSENSIETLDLSALDKLENVQCSKNQLQELSLNGSSLQSLIAGNNRLKKLIVTPRPSQLNHLDISYNELEVLPEWIAGCQHLRTLFASHNQLSSLPDHLFCNELSCLQTLQLSFNRLSALPAVIRQIPLQQLFLQSNRLTALPEHFFLASVRMRVLNITNNCLTMLPNIVGDNHQLERLYLSCNSLNCISILSNFTNLRSLHLAYNSITHLPDSCVSAWSELEELLMSGNQIQYLPGNIVKLQHLRVLRIHSNNLRSCPSLSGISGLRVLDVAHNQLDRVNLATLVPKKLQFLDISGNSRLHVDARQFQMYRTQRAMSLVDVSGQNRTSLPSSPPHQDLESCDLDAPWSLGFTETPGHRDRLCISQLRLPEFCNNEALIGLFDAENNSELPQMLVKVTPRILLEERTVEETANDYMKYTMLSAHRELKDKGQRCGVCAMLCHITKLKSQHSKHRYVLRIASVGEAKSVLCRSSGVVTLAHTPTQIQTVKSQLGGSSMFPFVVPDPHVAEILLADNDEFIIMANKRIWEVMSVDEAVSIVRPMSDPVRAAKKLQDVAQSYGCEDNLSIIILRFHVFQTDTDPLIRELRSTIKRATLQKDCTGLYEPHHNGMMDGDCDRSSPSGQSDQASSGRTILCHNERYQQSSARHYNASEKSDFISPRNYQSVLMHENGTRKMSTSKKVPDVYNNDNFADCEETSSDRSGTHLSEEQYRCWEYMLEQNTQLLFDKELDTLSRGFVRRSVPSRPGLWVRAKSNPHIATDLHQQPLLTRQFGSARSFQQQTAGRVNNNRRGLSGGPNAAYFGSLQRLMPYHMDYDFAVIRERADSNTDSLEHDDRMQKYWDVTTTEL
ncbi:protein phosphatase PHLPP-like protein isoform X1 [Nilaparvata lugens]|uniref:protein phosphatase PHLPP-like protein isoform X1 n=1 Tax=Nilaparvata lugens TaxID=108931 RepID=UPI00193E96C2|nr:protein phosphatase PHLPP-like protein isoform X1 [Nilaparvata lugens]XP_039279478.1 protein phosphatase PHLPP-like protein isoform X1 [Nilaparvata lugens]